ncbi:MAG: hydrogenase maturation nickel metallochaperone HypA [Gallionella sp.]|nr:hydrogenase maturation nickel metallochaperone HypA [Gallionella sp.]
MHEMSLVEGILQIVEDAARSQGFTRVNAMYLEIGQLACVEKEALQFCFDAVMRDSIAADARLEIIDVPGHGRCMQCHASMPIAALYEACPQCGGYQIEVTGGDGMKVKELEVE